MLQKHGLLVIDWVVDGELHRCGTIKKPRSKNGWYVAFPDGGYVCGNWETGEQWQEGKLSHDYVHNTNYKKKKLDQQLVVADECVKYLTECKNEGHNEYLVKKKILAHGGKFRGNKFILPLQDSDGKIWNYQTIFADGTKLFCAGARVSGCYFKIGFVGEITKVVVCEGFATGAAIHQETGLPVVIAFNAGNLKAVADSLPYKVVIAADNDFSNVGERYAKESGYNYVMPGIQGQDYSDLYVNEVAFKNHFICEAHSTQKIRAHGLVQEIADWITDTAIRPQPELSLAAALAFVGLLKGHRIEGATGLRTNLLVMSLAPTGGGKEHPQSCINKLAYACGMSKSLLGEPVSGSGFLTGLLEANRVGLMVMDEIGRFIGNISNKNSGGYQREIIDYIIKSFSKASGTLHGRQYGDSKKNPRIDIDQPHFCCLGSTVKEKLQAACTSSEIIDGFLNRWLVFSTDERPDRNKYAKRVSPPIELIDKISQIVITPAKYDNYGNPCPSEVRFCPEAWDIFEAFRDRIDSMVANAPYPLNMLYGRSAEHVEKIALTLCDNEDIMARDVNVAIEIVERSNMDISQFAGLISDNSQEADFVRVREIIRDAVEIKKSKLTIRCQFVQGGAKRIKEICEALIEDNSISERKEGNKTFYKWIG